MLPPRARSAGYRPSQDWETSGLLVLARHRDAMRSLSRQFAERTVAKTYTADVLGTPPQPAGAAMLARGGRSVAQPAAATPVPRHAAQRATPPCLAGPVRYTPLPSPARYVRRIAGALELPLAADARHPPRQCADQPPCTPYTPYTCLHLPRRCGGAAASEGHTSCSPFY